MFRYHKILVPLDGSDLAARALRPALTLAEAMPAALVLLRVVTPLPVVNVDPGLDERMRQSGREEARAYLEAVKSRLAPTTAGVTLEVATGAAAKAILKYAQANAVDLIVIASHGRSGPGRWVYGSVAAKILANAACSTIIIRAQADVETFTSKRILVPLDGSRLAERALAPAVAIAQAVSGQLVLLSVTLPLGAYAPPIYQEHLAQIERAENVRKKLYLSKVKAGLADSQVPVQTVTGIGSAAGYIINYADRHNVDLIAMSSHGRSGIDLWTYGSVTEKVLHGAHCATLVVRGRQGDNPKPATPPPENPEGPKLPA